MNRKLLEILACPVDGVYPLDLHIFEERDEIISGMLVCQNCLHWYPIRERIPEMFPDKFRDEADEVSFLFKWKEVIPLEVLDAGKPFNIKNSTH